MSKELDIKEMEAVIGDILNPYNDKEPEVEAWSLVTCEGWRKQPEGKWQFDEPDRHGNKKPYCSNCGEYHLSSWSDYTRCNYCPNCGAKMIEEN